MFFAGIDLGQSNDYTAIAVGEKAGTGDPDSWEFHIRHLERFRHRLYPDIATHIERLVSRLDRPYEIAVDATGVGPAVTDLLRQRGVPFREVTITGGDRQTSEGRSYRVPKRDLVSGLQVLLQSGRLRVAAGLPDAETLRSELQNFRVKVSASGHDSYEAWREKDHDDLVLAACLCSRIAARSLPDTTWELAGCEEPIADRDLYRWDPEPRPRTEHEQDHGIYDPY